MAIFEAGCGETRELDVDSATLPASPDKLATGGTEAGVVALGDSIFKGQLAGGICFSCHGIAANGTPLAPDLTDTTWLNGDGSREFIARTVRDGVPQPKQFPAPMPAFGQLLAAHEIDAVASFVYSLSRAAR